MPDTVRATAYLVIEGKRNQYLRADQETGLRPLEDAARVAEMRVNRPRVLKRDQIAVKVTVEIPKAAFDPIAPAALIVVPDDLVIHGPIEVQAEAPDA